MTPLEVTRERDGSITVTLAGVRHDHARIVRAAPLSHPAEYISLLDQNGDEITLLEDPATLDAPTRAIVLEELARSASIAITRVTAARYESGIAYLSVETSRGARDLAVRDFHERVLQFGHRLTIRDVDNVLYEIADLRRLDGRSASFIQRVLRD
jgi:hypothetical protein